MYQQQIENIYNIICNIENITQQRNPYFKNNDLLKSKVKTLLFKLLNESYDDDWIQNYDTRYNNVLAFNELIFQSIGERVPMSLMNDIYMFEDVDEYLTNLLYESAVEGPLERTIELCTNADKLEEYLLV